MVRTTPFVPKVGSRSPSGVRGRRKDHLRNYESAQRQHANESPKREHDRSSHTGNPCHEESSEEASRGLGTILRTSG